jgi:hypothetical protein
VKNRILPHVLQKRQKLSTTCKKTEKFENEKKILTHLRQSIKSTVTFGKFSQKYV